jgi:predicted LPLAT superfamily acyltransferase
MSLHWIKQRERGSVLAMKLISWIAFTFGRRVSRLLLYPICLYYMLFARAGVRASRLYLTRVFGRPPTWSEVFQHHFVFASVLLDRAFVLSGRQPELDISEQNRSLVYNLADQGRGCLLLGAHMGSFDVTRKVGQEHRRIEVNMMMYEENARKFNTVIESIGGRNRMKVIRIGEVDSLIRAKDRLDRGEWVGILADRAVDSDRLIRVPFLGETATFPAGPFLVASALKVPVVMFFCLYLGGNRYKEHFELFAEEITLNRSTREADLQNWVRRYAERLEHYCRLAPYNWFNFYDFWHPVLSPAKSAPRSDVELLDGAVEGKSLNP